MVETVVPYRLIVGSVIRFHRRSQILSAREVAIASASIGHCEVGSRALTCGNLWKVAKALGMTFEQLVRDCEKVERHLLRKGKADEDGVRIKLKGNDSMLITYVRNEVETALQCKS